VLGSGGKRKSPSPAGRALWPRCHPAYGVLRACNAAHTARPTQHGNKYVAAFRRAAPRSIPRLRLAPVRS